MKTCQETGRFHFSIGICFCFFLGEMYQIGLSLSFYIKYQKMSGRIFVLVNVLMALSYAVIGLLLVLNPESAFAQMMLPSSLYVYALGALLIIYGIFRAWRVYTKLKDEDDDDNEEYSYYDEKK